MTLLIILALIIIGAAMWRAILDLLVWVFFLVLLFLVFAVCFAQGLVMSSKAQGF